MTDFSAEYESRFVPTPAPRVPLNTPRQRLINAAAIVVFDENVDLADSWEIEKRVVKVLDTLNDESVWAYWIVLGNSGMRRVVNAVIRAAYHETFVRPLVKPFLSGLTSRHILEQLRAAGIPAQTVLFRRATGRHEIFFKADLGSLDAGTDSAIDWGKRIKAAFDGVEITDSYDTVATWRPGSPIIFATVYIKIAD